MKAAVLQTREITRDADYKPRSEMKDVSLRYKRSAKRLDSRKVALKPGEL